MISYNDFQKLDLRIATIKQAETVPNSNKLLKLTVDTGEKQPRQIIAGIAQNHQPENLINTQIVVLINLEPKKIMGLESQGMLLAATENGQPFLLRPGNTVSPGTQIS